MPLLNSRRPLIPMRKRRRTRMRHQGKTTLTASKTQGIENEDRCGYLLFFLRPSAFLMNVEILNLPILMKGLVFACSCRVLVGDTP